MLLQLSTDYNLFIGTIYIYIFFMESLTQNSIDKERNNYKVIKNSATNMKVTVVKRC